MVGGLTIIWSSRLETRGNPTCPFRWCHGRFLSRHALPCRLTIFLLFRLHTREAAQKGHMAVGFMSAELKIARNVCPRIRRTTYMTSFSLPPAFYLPQLSYMIQQVLWNYGIHLMSESRWLWMECFAWFFDCGNKYMHAWRCRGDLVMGLGMLIKGKKASKRQLVQKIADVDVPLPNDTTEEADRWRRKAEPGGSRTNTHPHTRTRR